MNVVIKVNDEVKQKMSEEFEKYRIKQDKLYKSDFDNFLKILWNL